MDTFSRFSVARELWQRGDLEQALAEVNRLLVEFRANLQTGVLELAENLCGSGLTG